MVRVLYGIVSHPVWVRGLKLCCLVLVAKVRLVAPRVGAWIETTIRNGLVNASESHPVWVRGLKLYLFLLLLPLIMSHPVWVRGLKLLGTRFISSRTASHPVWVRGLKQGNNTAPVGRYRRTPCGCVD